MVDLDAAASNNLSVLIGPNHVMFRSEKAAVVHSRAILPNKFVKLCVQKLNENYSSQNWYQKVDYGSLFEASYSACQNHSRATISDALIILLFLNGSRCMTWELCSRATTS